MNKSLAWLINLVKGMGDALVHPYRDNQPPKIGIQPFTEKPYKKRGIFA